MANKPAFIIDLQPKPGDDALLRIPSPRLQHFAGETPPALSPLDAFAAQSRLLAKQLDESQRKGRRISRLPPVDVARSLSKPRPGYSRSASAEAAGASREADSPVYKPGFEDPKVRPMSEHPRLSGVSVRGETELDDRHGSIDGLETDGFGISMAGQPLDYFDLVRPDQSRERVIRDKRQSIPKPANFQQPTSHPQQDEANSHTEPFPHPRPPYLESSEDDYTSSNAGSMFSQPRKLSSSSGVSVPQSPLSPFAAPFTRSPSIASELSVGAARLPRHAFNFSRPLSTSSGRISISDSTRQHLDNLPSPHVATQSPSPSGAMTEDLPSIPIQKSETNAALAEDQTTASDDQNNGTTSYTYGKFSLPRGRMLSRNSIIFSGLQTPHFQWDGPIFNDDILEPSRSHTLDLTREGTPLSSPASKIKPSTPPSKGRRPSNDELSGTPKSQAEQIMRKYSFEIAPPPIPSSDGPENDIAASLHSDSTIRPRTSRTAISVYEISPEEHVTKAIECHENGSLQESTYHLRIAAKQNHPTAMLLYALACRHGWGMRADPQEGIQWLRKAVDCAVLEVAEDEDPANQARSSDILERKTRRAQFALSIYELGVSHLNGWGIEQDKALALRCFEIAGNWGDGDALAEAGFCYAQGVGCKKDLKKAARFYRMAEARGMSMVGNSWIYKTKYMDEDEGGPSPSTQSGTRPKSTTPEKQARSRTKSLFGRKRPAQKT